MDSDLKQPKNINLYYKDKWKLIFKRLPNVQYFCSEANVPGLSITVIEQPTPLNVMPLGGNKVKYDNFTVTFRLDEDWATYKEIKKWIEGIAAPYSDDQHKALVESNSLDNKHRYSIYSDATLMTLTNVDNKNKLIKFEDVFPISLSQINTGYDNSDNVTMTATATFTFKYYDFD